MPRVKASRPSAPTHAKRRALSFGHGGDATLPQKAGGIAEATRVCYRSKATFRLVIHAPRLAKTPQPIRPAPHRRPREMAPRFRPLPAGERDGVRGLGPTEHQ